MTTTHNNSGDYTRNSVDIRDIKVISYEEFKEYENLKKQKSISYKRHIAKAFSYRMLGSFQTCVISYYFTGNFWVAGGIGLTEICIKPIIYFLHERVWYTFSQYGLKKINKK
jgi:uncharacterized membrane protein